MQEYSGNWEQTGNAQEAAKQYEKLVSLPFNKKSFERE